MAIPRLLVCLRISLVLLAAAVSDAQEISDRAEVRAVDLMVAIEPSSGSLLRRSLPKAFSVQDFELTLAGQEVTVLGVEDSLEVAAKEPWRVVIYVDVALSSKELVRSAAGLLAEAASDLAGLGSVEVVLADPDPRLVLAATRDESSIDRTLSGLALEPPGTDELIALRSELLRIEEVEGDLARAALAREIETIRRQSDRLLTWLTAAAETSARRALFLVSGGFDLDPAAFYRSQFDTSALDNLSSPRLGGLPQETARAIAAGKWIAFALRKAEPDPLPRRWGLQRSLLVRLDGNWDPKRAEAYAELAESLIRQHRWRRAEEALRRAAYHFYTQPKLRPRQAEVLLRLAHVLERQGRNMEADKVARKAIELDPTVAAKVSLPALLDPVPSVAMLAEATSGGLVSDREGLGDAISGLSRRLRLVYQAGALAVGEPAPLTVTYRRPGFAVLASGWARQGSPAVVATARARRLLDEGLELAPGAEQELAPASLRMACSFREGGEGGGESAKADLEVAIDPGLGVEWEGVMTQIRVTLSSWAVDGIQTVQRMSTEEEWRPGHEFVLHVELEASEQEPLIALAVEEMTTERWFATLLRCDEAIW